MASSKRVVTRWSHATSRSQFAGIDCNGTESGWYAQARSSAGDGSTGLAKPRNADCSTATGLTFHFWVALRPGSHYGLLRRHGSVPPPVSGRVAGPCPCSYG